jgi:hypothetical protein
MLLVNSTLPAPMIVTLGTAGSLAAGGTRRRPRARYDVSDSGAGSGIARSDASPSEGDFARVPLTLEEPDVPDGRANALAHGGFPMGVGQQHDELLSPVATDEVTVPDDRCEGALQPPSDA